MNQTRDTTQPVVPHKSITVEAQAFARVLARILARGHASQTDSKTRHPWNHQATKGG